MTSALIGRKFDIFSKIFAPSGSCTPQRILAASNCKHSPRRIGARARDVDEDGDDGNTGDDSWTQRDMTRCEMSRDDARR